MSNPISPAFSEYWSTCNADEQALLHRFFVGFSEHCLLRNKTKRLLREDLEKAILYYLENGRTLEQALALLDCKYLGGFYARPPKLWFPLDDAAKIYPLSMEHGVMSVFRLSVYLKAQIVPELLQVALNFTVKRFPTFTTTLKKGFFWHYLDTAKRRFCVEQERDIPCQPLKVSQSNSPTFRVIYYENRISMELFHVLTDATGALTFLKVLVAEYLRLLGVEVSPDENLWDINETPQTEEFENAFCNVPKTSNSSGFVDKAAVQMNGKITEAKPCRVLHFKMKSDELKAASSRHGITVTGYLLAQMFLSCKAAMDEIRGEMSIQLPVNMRKYYPSKTVRNFSMYCGIRLPVDHITAIDDIIPEIREQMKTKTAKDVMSEMLNATEKLVNMLRFIPLVIKQPVAKLVYGFLGEKLFTSTLSNMGVVQFPSAIAEHIESMDFALGTSVLNRVSCSVVTVNDAVTFTVSKITADPSFEEKMYDLLTADGIEVAVEGSELYGY